METYVGDVGDQSDLVQARGTPLLLWQTSVIVTAGRSAAALLPSEALKHIRYVSEDKLASQRCSSINKEQ